MLQFDLSPTLNNIRCILTTRWGDSGYRPMVVRTVESYFIDTSLDNDADTWSITIGDLAGEYLDTLQRDNEVRVQLFGVGAKPRAELDYILTGIADEISYNEQGTLTISGRDMSSLALDSIVPPQQFRLVRPWSIVESQAREIGFSRTSLARQGPTGGMVKKLSVTDGSESYWEFWYRLYRREQMWLWCSPEGILVGGTLDYMQPPAYFFGAPGASENAMLRGSYLPVEAVEVHKTTAQRVSDVWVYGHKGKVGFREKAHDGTLDGWIKRPRKILLDTESHTATGAQKLAWEEIFEGKVGAFEFKVTVADPGFTIRPNNIARVNLDQVAGDFFIVGNRIQADTNGLLQEVRMREKEYALSRRQPTIVVTQSLRPRDPKVIGEIPEQLPGQTPIQVAGVPEAWNSYFVKAGKYWAEYNGGNWDMALFIAVLYGICDVETQFRSIRANGGPGGDYIKWHPFVEPSGGATTPGAGVFPTPPGGSAPMPAPKNTPLTRQEYERQFANQAGDGYVFAEYAVGPMQLHDRPYKNKADDRLTPGKTDEFEGGRWHAESNIWVGAEVLREKLDAAVGTSGRDIDIWAGVSGYGQHEGDEPAGTPLTRYAKKVKYKVEVDPGYLKAVQAAIAAAGGVVGGKDGSAPIVVEPPPDKALPTKEQVSAFFSRFQLPPPLGLDDAASRRQAVVYCAMFGYYHRSEIHYPRGTADLAPPPNVPVNMDCSSFATWCYKSARFPDPSGTDYATIGWTGSLFDHGQDITFSQIQPGDLVFYYNPHAKNGHVAVYVGFNQVVSHGSEEGPHLVSVNYTTPAGYRTYSSGKTSPFSPTDPTPKPSEKTRRVMIQAGHDNGSHSQGPYGHETESGSTVGPGAPGNPSAGEVGWTKDMRDRILKLLAKDKRFDGVSGGSWDASAGPGTADNHDFDFAGDMFISLHYTTGDSGSGWFCGYTRGAIDGRDDVISANCGELVLYLATEIATISGHPPQLSSNTGFQAGATPSDGANATGWGYYAWGSTNRAAPNDRNHTGGTPGVPVKIIVENGKASDITYLDTKRDEIAAAYYRAICNYFGFSLI